jgi:iron(III) transport system ATP-binding protein
MAVTMRNRPQPDEVDPLGEPAPAIAVRGASRRFGASHALDGASLEVQPGELFALLGPSGSGKTTLLRLIAGFERPDSGVVEIAGRRVAGEGTWVEPEHRRIGMVFQDDSLFPHLTVAKNVGFGVRDDRERVREALELVELAHRADSHPGELSGGERQRVALARALAPRPDVVLLDEPFSSLDASLRGQLRRDVARILKASGATGLLVTHDQEEAFAVADRLAIIRDGRILQVGAPHELYWRPCCRWTASFLGDINLLRGRVDAEGVTTPIGCFACPLAGGAGAEVEIGVRPEHLALEADEDGDAVVVEREFRGHDVMYGLRHETAGRLLVQLPSVELFEHGQRVRLVPARGARAAVLDD